MEKNNEEGEVAKRVFCTFFEGNRNSLCITVEENTRFVHRKRKDDSDFAIDDTRNDVVLAIPVPLYSSSSSFITKQLSSMEFLYLIKYKLK